MKEKILLINLKNKLKQQKKENEYTISLSSTGLFYTHKTDMENILYHNKIITVDDFLHCSTKDFEKLFTDSGLKIILGLKDLLLMKYFDADFSYQIDFSSPFRLVYSESDRKRYYAVDIIDKRNEYQSCSLERLGFTDDEIVRYFTKYFFQSNPFSFAEILKEESKKKGIGEKDRIFRQKMNLYYAQYVKSEFQMKSRRNIPFLSAKLEKR